MQGVIHTDEAYVDDIAIITVNTSQMNEILERLRTSAAKFGLEINIPKTKIIHVSVARVFNRVVGGGGQICQKLHKNRIIAEHGQKLHENERILRF